MAKGSRRGLAAPERRLAVLVGVLALVVLAAVAGTRLPPATVGRAPDAEVTMLRMVNQVRLDHGMVPLRHADDMAEVAWSWSQRMAREGELEHNPDYGTQICCWELVTENVAMSEPAIVLPAGNQVGRLTVELHEALLDSPEHRDNLLDPRVDEVGIGVHVHDDGSVWITQNFRKRLGGTNPAP